MYLCRVDNNSKAAEIVMEDTVRPDEGHPSLNARDKETQSTHRLCF